MVEAVAKGVGRNHHLVQKELAVLNLSVGARQSGFAIPHHFDLGAQQLNPRLDLLENKIVVRRPAVDRQIAAVSFFALSIINSSAYAFIGFVHL